MGESHSRQQDIERRLRRLEARAQIAELCSMYCCCCDEHDLEGLMGVFTEDAWVSIPSFGVEARGSDAIRALYRGQLQSIEVSNHWTHDLVVSFSATDDCATGRLAAHAEVGMTAAVSVVAIRYEDSYRYCADRWKISRRRILFMYYVPLEEFRSRFLSPERIALPGCWTKADFPLRALPVDPPQQAVL